MSEAKRSVSLHRLSRGRFLATNLHGDTLEVGEGGDGAFTPVELLLTALAACSAVDVDYIVGKRAEPTSFRVRSEADKVRDDAGNHLTDLVVTFDLAFEDSEAGRAAREVLPRAVRQSHDRLCTVSRTIELGAAVTQRVGSLD